MSGATMAPSGVRERPILMSALMVRAILNGRKTQTRRVVLPQPFPTHGLQPMWGRSPDGFEFGTPFLWREVGADYPDGDEDDRRCPYGQPGDRLWVRETWATGGGNTVAYRADGLCGFWFDDGDVRRFVRHGGILDGRSKVYSEHGPSWGLSKYGGRWRSSIHMPRWASRLTLEVTGVRVERVQDISFWEIRAEGFRCPEHDFAGGFCTSECFALRSAFHTYWNALNRPRGYSYESNPWVWVVEFRRADAVADAAWLGREGAP